VPDVGLGKERRIGRTGYATRMKVKKYAYILLAGQPEGKGYLGKHKHRW
jgi:hypothetical protein